MRETANERDAFQRVVLLATRTGLEPSTLSLVVAPFPRDMSSEKGEGRAWNLSGSNSGVAILCLGGDVGSQDESAH